MAARSRYAAGRIEHPSPARDPEGFLETLAAAVRRHEIGVVLPAADIPANVLLDGGDRMPRGVRLVLPPRDAVKTAHDKIALVELAQGQGVRVPRGVRIGPGGASVAEAADRVGFPLVLKPRWSRVLFEGIWRPAGVRIATDHDELDRALDEQPWVLSAGALLQERVPGEGRGVFLLARDGAVRVTFAHRRIREKPPWGGVSTLCETAPPEPELVAQAEGLVRALRWSGVAMVEFRWDPETRRSWLMEINGRFWGSMQLAVASGVDFPWLLYQQEILGTEPRVGETSRRRLWWILGDLDHALIRLRASRGREAAALLSDLASTRSGTPLDLDTLAWDDPVPFLYEVVERIGSEARALGRSLARRTTSADSPVS